MTRQQEIDLLGLANAEEEMEELEREIRLLRAFVRDVQLGVRDLGEYEDVCGRSYL
jgi:hypothetical protein